VAAPANRINLIRRTTISSQFCFRFRGVITKNLGEAKPMVGHNLTEIGLKYRKI
jgi:hypothetical protein